MGTSLFDPAQMNGYGDVDGGLLGPPPMSMGAPAPSQPNVSMPMQPKGSMIDRVIQRLKSNVQGDAPAGYSAILSPDQIENARPTLFQTIFKHGADPAEFQKNLMGAVQASQMPAAIALKQRYQNVQAQIAQQFPPVANESAEGTRDRLARMYVEGARLGADPAWLKDLGEVAKESIKVPKEPKSEIEWHNLGGKTIATLKGSMVPLATFEHTASEDEKIHWAELLAQSRAVLANSEESKQQTIAESESKDFQSRTKKMTDMAPKFTGFANSLAEARAGNPAAYKSTLLNFVSAVDNNPQMRQGILNYLTQVDPSIKGRMEVAMDKAASGKLPPRVLNEMEQMVNRYKAGVHADYTRQRAARVQQNPRLHSKLPEADEIFGPLTSLPGAAAASRIPAMR